jgi:uncharacterized membrane protein YkvI
LVKRQKPAEEKKMPKETWWRGIKIGMTIVGTEIGAGFASGREIWEFFGVYGEASIGMIILAMLLFALSSIVILWVGWRRKANSYLQVLEELMGKRMAAIFDIVIPLYLMTSTVVMFAGSGATFAQWDISFMIGVAFLLIAVEIVMFYDIEGLMALNTILVPFLVMTLVIVCLHTVLFMPNHIQPTTAFDGPAWPSAVTYASLNVLPIVAVLSTIGSQVKDSREIWIGGIFSTVILTILSIMLILALMRISDQLHFYEIPLFGLVRQFPTAMIMVVSIILWIAIYTTALSNLYGIVYRLTELVRLPVWLISGLLMVLMIPFTQVGFANLVKVVYPVYGVVNLFILAVVILYPLQIMSGPGENPNLKNRTKWL